MTKKELKQDIKFLLRRTMEAGVCRFDDETRDVGVSSNSIVAIAYDIISLDNQVLPCDSFDLMACERMWKKLPEHRKTSRAKKALQYARKIEEKK